MIEHWVYPLIGYSIGATLIALAVDQQMMGTGFAIVLYSCALRIAWAIESK